MVYVVVLAGVLVAAVVLYAIFVPKEDSILEPKEEDISGAFVPTQPDPDPVKDEVAEVQSYNFETTADLAAETAVITPEPTPFPEEKVKVVKKKATSKKTKSE